jgi:preprotein translocase subunit SecE
MEVKRVVGLVYVVGGVIATVVFSKFITWVWPWLQRGLNEMLKFAGIMSNPVGNYSILPGYVTLTSLLALLAGGGLTYKLYQPERYRSFLSEVVVELKKVTWPGWDETRRSTLIVIVFTVVLAGFLWLSDSLWEYLTNLILTPGA